MITDRFTTIQVCTITGISKRKLDYWASSGMLQPSLKGSNGPGTRRLYNFNDLVRLRFVQRLQEMGWSTQKVRKALQHLDKFSSEGSGYKYVSLVLDKKTILAVCENEEKQQVLLDVLNPGGQQVLWIILETLRDETKRKADQALNIFDSNADHRAAVAV